MIGNPRREIKRRQDRQRLIGFLAVLFCCLSVTAVCMIADTLVPDSPADSAFIPSATDIDVLADVLSRQSFASESPANEDEWSLTLVNKWNCIPDDYEVELTELSNGQSVDERIYPELQEMFDSARSEGIYPEVVSGYRTAEDQQRMMDDKIAQFRAEGCSDKQAMAEAEAWVAAPGTSEHQSGLAVDINADGINSAGYDVYGWLAENAYRYGFILRYPAEKTGITGVNYEPWHYRYVGEAAATEIYNQGVCLEEYLEGAQSWN